MDLPSFFERNSFDIGIVLIIIFCGIVAVIKALKGNE